MRVENWAISIAELLTYFSIKKLQILARTKAINFDQGD